MYGRIGNDVPTFNVILVLVDGTKQVVGKDVIRRRFREIASTAGKDGYFIGEDWNTYIPPHRIKEVIAKPTGDTAFVGKDA